MHLKTKILLSLCTIIFCQTLTFTAFASSETDEMSTWDKFKDAGASLWGDIQEAAPGWADKAQDIAGTIKDKAPDVIDAAKDKAQDIAETVKDKAPEVIDKAKDGLQSAGEAVSEYRETSEQEFWQWFDDQTNGGGNISTTAPAQTPASTTSDASQSPADTAQSSTSTIPDATKSLTNTTQTTASSQNAPTDSPSANVVPSTDPDVAPSNTVIVHPIDQNNPVNYEPPSDISKHQLTFFDGVLVAIIVIWIVCVIGFIIKSMFIVRADHPHKSRRSCR